MSLLDPIVVTKSRITVLEHEYSTIMNDLMISGNQHSGSPFQSGMTWSIQSTALYSSPHRFTGGLRLRTVVPHGGTLKEAVNFLKLFPIFKVLMESFLPHLRSTD